MSEIYLVARGSSVAVVAGQELSLAAGDMLVVEPGEDHTFLSSSENYLHFVVQAPFVKGDKVDLTGGQSPDAWSVTVTEIAHRLRRLGSTRLPPAAR